MNVIETSTKKSWYESGWHKDEVNILDAFRWFENCTKKN